MDILGGGPGTNGDGVNCPEENHRKRAYKFERPGPYFWRLFPNGVTKTKDVHV